MTDPHPRWATAVAAVVIGCLLALLVAGTVEACRAVFG